MRELMVRIRALAGRMHPAKAHDEVQAEYQIGDYRFYPQQLKLEHLGASTELSPREVTILKMLCDNKGEVLNMRPLLLELWGDDSFFNSRSLQVFISKLRRKLEADRQETITIRLQSPDTPSDVSVMRADFHSLAIDHTCVSLDLDFFCPSFNRKRYQ